MTRKFVPGIQANTEAELTEALADGSVVRCLRSGSVCIVKFYAQLASPLEPNAPKTVATGLPAPADESFSVLNVNGVAAGVLAQVNADGSVKVNNRSSATAVPATTRIIGQLVYVPK